MVDEMTKNQREAFREGLLTFSGSTGHPKIDYPVGVTNKHYLRIVAKGFDHPKIQTPPDIAAAINLAKAKVSSIISSAKEASEGKVEGFVDAVGGKYAEEIKESYSTISKSVKKYMNTMGTYKGTFFEFNTYVPGSFSDSVEASWEQHTTDTVRGAMQTLASKASDSLGSLGGGLGNLLSGGDILTKGLYVAGKAQVPAETSIFKSTSSSGINVMVKFAPRNKVEANIMIDAIRLFRNGTRPTIDENSVFFDYPPIYDITICPARSNDVVKKSAYQKYPPMSLNSTNIVYSEGNPLSTFFYDGTPTDAVLTLNFSPIIVNYNGAKYQKGFKNG